ncbi:MAG: methyl-accepting chemotaxis protein [Candidatus Sericytochromatia bacterium]
MINTLNKKVIILLLPLLILIITASFFSINRLNKLNKNFDNLANQKSKHLLMLKNIQISLTQGHLYLEQILVGDKEHNYSDVLNGFNKAINNCNYLLKGNTEIEAISEPTLIKNIDIAKNEFEKIIKISKIRYANYINGASIEEDRKVDIDFDKTYEKASETLEKVVIEIEKELVVDSKEVKDIYSSSVKIILVLFIIVLLYSILVLKIIFDRLTKPIRQITQATEEFTKNRKLVDLKIIQNDEIGILSEKINFMIKEIIKVNEALLEEKQSIQIKVEEAIKDSEKSKKELEIKLQEITLITEEVKKAKDESEKNKSLIEKQQVYIKNEVENIILTTEQVSYGNLSILLDVFSNENSIGLLKTGINKMISDLNNLVKNIINTSDNISNYSKNLAENTDSISESSNEQSNKINEIAAAVFQITQTINNNTKNIINLNEFAEQVNKNVNLSIEKMKNTTDNVYKLSEFVSIMGNNINSLKNNIYKIQNFATIISQIASQTNLLSLNAAIEAARAGEHGRGFSVVANEIKKLSDKTVESVNEINNFTEIINDETSKTIKTTQEGINKISDIINLISSSEKEVGGISKYIESLQSMINEVSTASEEQTAVLFQISSNIEAINDSSNQFSETLKRTFGLVDVFDVEVNNLKEVVSGFKV